MKQNKTKQKNKKQNEMNQRILLTSLGSELNVTSVFLFSKHMHYLSSSSKVITRSTCEMSERRWYTMFNAFS